MKEAKRVALRSADAVTVNSSVTERAVLNLAPNLANLNRIPMGISADPLGPNQAELAAQVRTEHRRGEGPLLVFVGRLVAEKGVEDLLRAVALLTDDLPDVTALVVGQGQDRANFENLAATLGIDDRVVFTGWIDPIEVGAYLSAADQVVGPSRRAEDGWIEAQGLILLEAMVGGTPVIATRLGGVIDYIVHEETGLLVDERSPEQIAQAVRRLRADAALVRNMTQLARERAAAFSRETSTKSFSSLFSDLMEDMRSHTLRTGPS
jgi:glycosyltransferase involved in cell wall biosynthesis